MYPASISLTLTVDVHIVRVGVIAARPEHDPIGRVVVKRLRELIAGQYERRHMFEIDIDDGGGGVVGRVVQLSVDERRHHQHGTGQRGTGFARPLVSDGQTLSVRTRTAPTSGDPETELRATAVVTGTGVVGVIV